MRKSVVIRMQEELEARPIAHLVQMATRYSSRIYLEVNQVRVNAKSIMGMMSLAMMQWCLTRRGRMRRLRSRRWKTFLWGNMESRDRKNKN